MPLQGNMVAPAGLCSVFLFFGAICMLAAGVQQYSLDPNKAAWPVHSSTGLPTVSSSSQLGGTFLASTYTNGGETWPNNLGRAFSCDGIAAAFFHNTSYRLSNRCILRASEMAADGNGDGTYGDSEGFVYPGTPQELVCEDWVQPGAGEVAKPPYLTATIPDDSEFTYHANKAHADYFYQQCRRSQTGRDVFIGTGVLLLVLGILWPVYLNFEMGDKPQAATLGPLLVSLSGLGLALSVSSAYMFFSFSPATTVAASASFLHCASMTDAEYFSGMGTVVAEGGEECRVTNASCNPFDFTDNFFSATNSVGECVYVNPTHLKVKCSEIKEDLIGGASHSESCEAEDCQYASQPYGANYLSECCQKRRLCCGNDADCTGVACRWRNTTYPVAEDGEQKNQCYNYIKAESFECNGDQRRAWDMRLRSNGKCWDGSVYKTGQQTQDYAGSSASSIERCQVDNKERMKLAARVYYRDAPFLDENLRALASDDVLNNVPSCLVRTISNNCQTACWSTGETSCPNTEPYADGGAPSNCTWVDTVSRCLPKNDAYTEELRAKRPTEYCESIMGLSDTEEVNILDCEAAAEHCVWTNGRCRARSCPGYQGNTGYQTANSPPCVPSPSTNNANDRNFRVCEDASKGCTPVRNSAYCSIAGGDLTANWYYGASPPPLPEIDYREGVVFPYIKCPFYASVENCTTGWVPCIGRRVIFVRLGLWSTEEGQ